MRLSFAVFVLILFPFAVIAQFHQYPLPRHGNFEGGLGLNWIDGQLYYTLHINPEISFTDFGAGLDLMMDFDQNGKIREENFNTFSDYLSIIRYVRYGFQNDPLYAKLGALDYYTLGHGSIMYAYNNSPGIDNRKTGVIFDLDMGQLGFESIYSSFAEPGILGLRGYISPFKLTSVSKIPVVGGLEVGLSYAGDYNRNAGTRAGIYNNETGIFNSTMDAGSVHIIGADLTVPLLASEMLNVKAYTDYTKIIDYGSGIAAGIIGELNPYGSVITFVRFERRFNQKHYLPSYFGALYEIERFRIDSSGNVHSRIQTLEMDKNAENGIFGELGMNLLGIFNITGSYQKMDKSPQSGRLHIHSEIAPEEFPFLLRAGYDKTNIGNETAIFKLDDKSYLFFEAGYKPVKFLVLSLVYYWTFTPIRDSDKNVINYIPQKRFEPRVYFVYPFNF